MVGNKLIIKIESPFPIILMWSAVYGQAILRSL